MAPLLNRSVGVATRPSILNEMVAPLVPQPVNWDVEFTVRANFPPPVVVWPQSVPLIYAVTTAPSGTGNSLLYAFPYSRIGWSPEIGVALGTALGVGAALGDGTGVGLGLGLGVAVPAVATTTLAQAEQPFALQAETQIS